MTFRGFEIVVPASGGKAGKGRNITGSVQVRKNNVIEAQFRFNRNDVESKRRALGKAQDFIFKKTPLYGLGTFI